MIDQKPYTIGPTEITSCAYVNNDNTILEKNLKNISHISKCLKNFCVKLHNNQWPNETKIIGKQYIAYYVIVSLKYHIY